MSFKSYLLIFIFFVFQSTNSNASLSKCMGEDGDQSVDEIRKQLEHVNKTLESRLTSSFGRIDTTEEEISILIQNKIGLSNLLIEFGIIDTNSIKEISDLFMTNSFFDQASDIVIKNFIDSILTEKEEVVKILGQFFHTNLLSPYLKDRSPLGDRICENFTHLSFLMVQQKPSNSNKLNKLYWNKYKNTLSTIFNITRSSQLIHDGTICLVTYFSGFLRLNGLIREANSLLLWIYQQNPTSDLAKYFYALLCLHPLKDAPLKESIFKELIKGDRLQTEMSYCQLAQVLTFEKKFDEALFFLQSAKSIHRNSPLVSMSLAMTYFLTGRYQESLEEYHRYLSFRLEDTQVKIIKKFMLLINIKAGNVDKVNELLRERQREALSRRKQRDARIAERIRQHQANIRMQEEQAVQRTPVSQVPKKSIAQKSITDESNTLEPSPLSLPTESRNLKSQYKDIPQKKIKKRGTPRPTEMKGTKESQSVTQKEKIVTIEDLLHDKPKSTYRTFCKLFDSIVGVDHKISMSDVSNLFDALEQEFDPKKGKGSHTKITIGSSFADAGHERMIILSNNTFLSAAQISNIVDTFLLDYHLYPHDMEEVIKAKRPWLFNESFN